MVDHQLEARILRRDRIDFVERARHTWIISGTWAAPRRRPTAIGAVPSETATGRLLVGVEGEARAAPSMPGLACASRSTNAAALRLFESASRTHQRQDVGDIFLGRREGQRSLRVAPPTTAARLIARSTTRAVHHGRRQLVGTDRGESRCALSSRGRATAAPARRAAQMWTCASTIRINGPNSLSATSFRRSKKRLRGLLHGDELAAGPSATVSIRRSRIIMRWPRADSRNGLERVGDDPPIHDPLHVGEKSSDPVSAARLGRFCKDLAGWSAPCAPKLEMRIVRRANHEIGSSTNVGLPCPAPAGFFQLDDIALAPAKVGRVSRRPIIEVS